MMQMVELSENDFNESIIKCFNQQLQTHLKKTIKIENLSKEEIEDTKNYIEILEQKKYSSQNAPNKSMNGIDHMTECWPIRNND